MDLTCKCQKKNFFEYLKKLNKVSSVLYTCNYKYLKIQYKYFFSKQTNVFRVKRCKKKRKLHAKISLDFYY